MQGELEGRVGVEGLGSSSHSTSRELPVHGKTVGAAACTAGDPLALETVLTVDAVTLAAALVVILLDGTHVVLNVGPDGALCLHHLVHQDLLHLPIVEVVQVPDSVLSSGNEV